MLEIHTPFPSTQPPSFPSRLHSNNFNTPAKHPDLSSIRPLFNRNLPNHTTAFYHFTRIPNFPSRPTTNSAALMANTHNTPSRPSPDLSQVVVHTAAVDISATQPLLSASSPATQYGSTLSPPPPKKGNKAKNKGAPGSSNEAGTKEKNPHKKVADALKTDMAAERTFFKWLWTALHIAAIGTFAMEKGHGRAGTAVFHVALVAACTVVALGTFVYYQRRKALRTGDMAHIPVVLREHSASVLVGALAVVIVCALVNGAMG